MRARTLVIAGLIAGLAACGESDDPNQLTGGPSAEESAAGADLFDPTEDDDDGAGPADVDSPVEPADPHLDPMQDPEDLPEPPAPPPPAQTSAPAPAPAPAPATKPAETKPAETKPATCQRATGYRSGKAFSICVTPVDGKLVEVNTARVFLKMRAAAKARGVALRIVSGFRTMAQQQYLYNCYLTKKCNNGNLAARPGYSNHQSGHALDLNTSSSGVYSFLANHGKTYGFRRTVPSENWHWERW